MRPTNVTITPAWLCVAPSHRRRLLPATVVVIVLVLQWLTSVEVTVMFSK